MHPSRAQEILPDPPAPALTRPPAHQDDLCAIWARTTKLHEKALHAWTCAKGLHVVSAPLGLCVLRHGLVWVSSGGFRKAAFWSRGWHPNIPKHEYASGGNARIPHNVRPSPLPFLVAPILHRQGLSWSTTVAFPPPHCVVSVFPVFPVPSGYANKRIPPDVVVYPFVSYPGAELYTAGYPTSFMNPLVLLKLWVLPTRYYWLAAARSLLIVLGMAARGPFIRGRLQGSRPATWRLLGGPSAVGILAIQRHLLYAGRLAVQFKDRLALFQVQRARGSVPLPVRPCRPLSFVKACGGDCPKPPLGTSSGISQGPRLIEGVPIKRGHDNDLYRHKVFPLMRSKSATARHTTVRHYRCGRLCLASLLYPRSRACRVPHLYHHPGFLIPKTPALRRSRATAKPLMSSWRLLFTPRGSLKAIGPHKRLKKRSTRDTPTWP